VETGTVIAILDLEMSFEALTSTPLQVTDTAPRRMDVFRQAAFDCRHSDRTRQDRNHNLWLLARAAGARVPRRLICVVDRRAVVDRATRVAERMQRSMPDDLESRVEFEDGSRALSISTLRGGFIDNRD